MKKVLIVNNNLHIGGVQKSLVNLLNEIHDQYDITLVLFYPAGTLLKDVPKNVRLLSIHSAYCYLGMTKYDVAGKPLQKLCRSFFAAISHLLGRSSAIACMAMGQKNLAGYDVAISFMHDGSDRAFYGGCNEFVLRHCCAERKVTFLHGDFSLCGGNTSKNRKRYEAFDLVAACSDGCAKQFIRCMPHLNGKVRTVCNCHDFAAIQKAAEENAVQLPQDRVNIVTVARFGKEKSVVRGVEAVSGFANYHYYIIGDGIQKEEIKERICQLGLKDNVTLLGELANPYGYIKAADLLLIPSVSEAAPMVIGEAASLGTPILSTLTSSAEEMIENPGYGWVCENSVAGLRHMLCRILSDPQLLKPKKEYLSTLTFDNSVALEQLAQILR